MLVESSEQSHLLGFHVTHFFSSPKIRIRQGLSVHPIVLDVPIISTACTIHSLGDLLGETWKRGKCFFVD